MSSNWSSQQHHKISIVRSAIAIAKRVTTTDTHGFIRNMVLCKPKREINMSRYTHYFLVLCLCAIACKDKDTSLPADEQLALDIQIIEDYLLENGITAESTASGLHYNITEDGDGTHPDASSIVEVKYRGYLTSGATFDKTADATTLKFTLGGTIQGWIEGIPLIESGGGKGQLFIPSHLGYGNNPPLGSIITKNAVLIFDVTVIGFE